MNKKYQIFARPRSYYQQLLPDTDLALPSQRSRTDQIRASRRTPIARAKVLCIALLGVVSASLALSGCGGFVGAAGNAAGAGLLIALPDTVDFGTVPVGQKATSSVTLINKSSSPIEISQVTLTGQGFSVSSQNNLPATLAAGSTMKVAVEFNPVASGDAQGQVSVTSSISATAAVKVGLKGKGTTTGTTTLSINPTSLSFGNVLLNTPSTQAITLTSTGTSAVTVSAATISGTGFTMSGVTFPVKINAGQSATLNVQFDPTVTGSATGQLTITSNSSTNGTAVVSLSGTGTTSSTSTGTPTLSINPTNVSFGNVLLNTPSTQAITLTSTGTSAVTVSAATISGTGFTMSGITLPVTLNTGQSATLNVQFDPTVTGSATGQLTITSDSSTNGTAVVSLNGTGTATGTPTLSIDTTNLAFGNVSLNMPSTQPITLTSTGTSAVTVSAAAISGTGFTMSGVTFPVTLNPGQSATLNVQFDPTVTGAVTGQLTITSNSSANGTAVVSLSGTGVTHEVDLSWVAPTNSPDPVAGYNVYRAPTGSSSYQLLNSAQTTQMQYVDSAVQSGASYDYFVKSVDAYGIESSPSNTTTAAIP
jgi:hypothetical protein